MAPIQRVLSWVIVPVLALLTFRIFLPGYFQTLRINPLSHTFVFENVLARSETPIVVSAFTHWSHYEKVAKLAVVLAELGYPVIFVTGRIFEENVANLHPRITFHPLLGGNDKMSAEDYATYASKEPGIEQELFIMKVALMGSMKPAHDTLQQVFEGFRREYGHDKPLISLFDTPVIGHHPILLGSPGIKPDASMVISYHPLSMNSNDTFPFYMGRAPHAGPDARAIHQKANEDQQADYKTATLSAWYWEVLAEHGAKTDRHLMDSMHSVTDRILALGVPEFEFPRHDLRPTVHYLGALKKPNKTPSKQPDLPVWWDEVVDAKNKGKKIVAVSQGTVETDLTNLVLPTLEALKDKDDVMVVATTVAFEPEEVKDLIVPTNARVAKFVPYDMLLPMVGWILYCPRRADTFQVDVLVNNGGYGAVIQALEHGVPLVVAGEGQDKAVTNAIVQWSGVGLNIGDRSPGLDKIREGIELVLENSSYKTKADEMRLNIARHDVSAVVDGVIQDVVHEWASKRH